MKTEEKHIAKIRNGFHNMKTKEDLLELLNQIQEIIYADKATPIKLKSLTYFSNPKWAKSRYRIFHVNKKSGRQRTIHAPVKDLKIIQKDINFALQCVFKPHTAATGFVPEKSIVTNALAHRAANYVYNIDLKDFFPSIELHRVKACLKLPPFNLDGEKEPLAYRIANLCCTTIEVERKLDGEWSKVLRSVLPQGAPTSPTLTNIVCQKLDHRLSGLAKRFNLIYTRYADDITFSSMHNVYQKDADFLNELNRIIEEQNFSVNHAKTRLQKNGFQKEVTGLVVNEKVNVRQRYIKQLRMWINYLERYGYTKAESLFRNDYLKDKGHVKKHKPNMISVISGKLEYLSMVRGQNDLLVKKLVNRFNKALFQNSNEPDKNFDRIINHLADNDIDTAMAVFERLKID
jgi:RNA-directed DNA polymerase